MEGRSAFRYFAFMKQTHPHTGVFMKSAILIGLMFAGSLANASWFQNNCSNGAGTVKLADGHDDFYIRLTEQKWENDQIKETILEDERFQAEYSNEVVVHESSESSCNQEQGWGFATWYNVKQMTVTITKSDGSLFTEHTLGVSQDRKSVKAFMICEEFGNSEAVCESK